MPLRIVEPSMESLVVPATLVTIALSSSKKVFKRLDLPTLGRPIKQILIPSLIILASSDFFKRLFNLSLIANNLVFKTFKVISSASSYSG